MPRRAAAGVRPLDPDPLHESKLVQQVINKVRVDGKKSTAEQIVYDALEILSRRTGKEPVESLEASIKTLTPVLEVRSRRGAHKAPAPGLRGAPPPRRWPPLPGAGRGARPPCAHPRRPLARGLRPP